jgi:diguanylate cyclase (GGDEF)-like protein
MDERVAPKRDKGQAQHAAAPPGWAEAQDSLAAALGLSLLLVEGHQPPQLAVSNNNSICRAFQSSPAHVHLCDPYCGVAFDRAISADAPVHYRCHAGLHCVATPVEIEKGRKLAIIGGRTFLTSADYRTLAESFRIGPLQDLLTTDLFRNVIFASRSDLGELVKAVTAAAAEYRLRRGEFVSQASPDTSVEVEAKTKQVARVETSDRGGMMPGSTVHEIWDVVERTLSTKYKLTSVAFLLREGDHLAVAFAAGRFDRGELRVSLEVKDARLVEAVRTGTSLMVNESKESTGQLKATGKRVKQAAAKTVELFPLSVGNDIKGALLIGDATLTEDVRRGIHSFCRDLALPLEVLRLREELEKRAHFAYNLQNFTARINAVEPAESYDTILQHSVELLHAERCSLLLFDEHSNELAIKAALGLRKEVTAETRIRLGDGVCGAVLKQGRPLVVHDLQSEGVAPAPAERLYKTKSFISYPIIIGGRKVGVLNVTDKAGGGSYDEVDLGLLDSIAPQLALALDRADWQEKAAQFQLMSITDPLTGLLNRRYLEERMTEELNRSRRYEYAMSFMMIDIDDFKLYNDRHGHQAGDLALEMTAQCLKSALRSADIASRYGGEEFCILLPQTNLDEANIIAERIRRRVERTRYPHGKAQPLGAVTVSIGVSAFSAELETPPIIIGAADRALYLAKSRGKNRVESYQDIQRETQADDATQNA